MTVQKKVYPFGAKGTSNAQRRRKVRSKLSKKERAQLDASNREAGRVNRDMDRALENDAALEDSYREMGIEWSEDLGNIGAK